METKELTPAEEAKLKNNPYIELQNIVHEYSVIRALDNVNFWLNPKEVVGLVGDNGAGKSTLIKILSGVIQPTKGNILVEGKPKVFKTSKIAMDCGIETIYQDMNLIDLMDITRNIFTGREKTDRFGFLKLKYMKEKAMEILEKEVTIEGIRSPQQIVGRLSGGQKQAVSIGRAMFFKSKVLLLDEPTSALSVRETQAFLDHIVRLRNDGMSVVLVTHNIYHAYQVADRFVLLSHGKKILDIKKEDASVEELTRIIVAH